MTDPIRTGNDVQPKPPEIQRTSTAAAELVDPKSQNTNITTEIKTSETKNATETEGKDEQQKLAIGQTPEYKEKAQGVEDKPQEDAKKNVPETQVERKYTSDSQKPPTAIEAEAERKTAKTEMATNPEGKVEARASSRPETGASHPRSLTPGPKKDADGRRPSSSSSGSDGSRKRGFSPFSAPKTAMKQSSFRRFNNDTNAEVTIPLVAAPTTTSTAPGGFVLSDEHLLEGAEKKLPGLRAYPSSQKRSVDKESELRAQGKKVALWRYHSWLAFSTLGIVYGDVGTSPLYTFSTIFLAEPTEDDLLGALSLIIWALIMVVVVKYMLFILLANDNGEGGTFAMFAVLARSLKQKYHNRQRLLSSLMTGFEVLACVGVAALLADGILTPPISLLGAVAGLKVASDGVTSDVVTGVAIAIAIGLFLIQYKGTSLVAQFFSPIMSLWFVAIFCIGAYNVSFAPQVFNAFNPAFGFRFFLAHGYDGWASLGPVFLCVTGAEATFADLGHFSVAGMRLSALGLVIPSLLLCYCGQAAQLLLDPTKIANTFFLTLPNPVFYPMLVLAFLAAVVASQAIISATFSLITQAMQLDMMPKLTVRHTNPTNYGQVYVPEVNYCYMVLIVIVIAVYRDATALGYAYGISVSLAMLIATVFFSFNIWINFNLNPIFGIAFFLWFGLVDVAFLAANLLKVPSGGWFAVLITIFFSVVLVFWHWGRKRMLESKAELFTVPFEEFFEKGSVEVESLRPVQEGLCVCLSAYPNVVPPAYVHYLRCVRGVPRYTVFVNFRSSRHPFVKREIAVEPVPCANEHLRIYHCVIDNGYKQSVPDASLLAEGLARKLQCDPSYFFLVSQDHVIPPVAAGVIYRSLVRAFEVLLGLSRTVVKSFHIPPDRCLEVGIQIPLERNSLAERY